MFRAAGSLFALSITAVPLLLIPMLLYSGVGCNGPIETLVMQWTLPSGATTYMTKGNFILMVACAFLLIEIAKATNTGAKSIIDLMLSVLLLVAAVVLYLIVPGYGGATFLLLTVMQGVDVTAQALR